MASVSQITVMAKPVPEIKEPLFSCSVRDSQLRVIERNSTVGDWPNRVLLASLVSLGWTLCCQYDGHRRHPESRSALWYAQIR